MGRGRGCPRALRLFGEDLNRWLLAERESVADILTRLWPFATWISGGCGILARALHEWIGEGSSLWAIYDRWRMMHVLVRVGDCYLDAIGAFTREELLKLWKDEEVNHPGLKSGVSAP